MSPPSQFPRRMLWLPPAVPAGLALLAALMSAFGHTWNVHGDLILVLLGVGVPAIVAFVVELIVLPGAITRLIRQPAARTMPNVMAAAFAGVFVLVVVAYVVVAWIL